jgi:uncharacterized protein (DUF2236 family)
MGSARDDGYFPLGRSLLRRVHSQRAVGLLFGQRALMVGALNPLNFVGTIEHTRGRTMPFARLAHTAKAFEAIFFSSREETDRVLERVRARHDGVHGRLAEGAGPFPAGTPYSAFDPKLMLWTIAVIADSALRFYELLVSPLREDEREAAWREYLRFGELFGMPREVAPPTYRGFRDYWERTLAGAEMHLTPTARRVGYATAFEIPLPGLYAPAKRVHDLIMLGSLPSRVRALYGLRWTSAHAIAFRTAVSAVRRAQPLVPRAVREGRNSQAYDLVARTERRRIERGEPTPQVSP